MGGALLVLVLALSNIGAAQENVLVLYGSPDRDWVAAVAAKFEKDTGIKVQWIRASSNEMYARIEAEKANPRGMSARWTGDPHFDAAEKGLTEPLFAQDGRAGGVPCGIPSAVQDHRPHAGPLGWAVNEGMLKSSAPCPRPG
jgi:ABC-type Fe3+ transport system substrate-binding protein